MLDVLTSKKPTHEKSQSSTCERAKSGSESTPEPSLNFVPSMWWSTLWKFSRVIFHVHTELDARILRYKVELAEETYSWICVKYGINLAEGIGVFPTKDPRLQCQKYATFTIVTSRCMHETELAGSRRNSSVYVSTRNILARCLILRFTLTHFEHTHTFFSTPCTFALVH